MYITCTTISSSSVHNFRIILAHTLTDRKKESGEREREREREMERNRKRKRERQNLLRSVGCR